MTAHSNMPKVQDRGCLTLFNLSFNESVSVRIQLIGGLAVLEQNPSNSDAETALQRIRASTNLDSFFGLRLVNLVCGLGDIFCGRKS
jgi:hypothetical protein